MGHMYHPACDKSTSHGRFAGALRPSAASPSHIRPPSRYAGLGATLAAHARWRALSNCPGYYPGTAG